MIQIDAAVAFVATVPLITILIRSHPKHLHIRASEFVVEIIWDAEPNT